MKKQCTFLQERVEDCLPTLSLGKHLLSQSNGINTPAQSCANEPLTDGSQDCTCGKATSDCSIHPSTPAAWIASMQDSLARTLALLESRQEYLMEPEAVFTVKSCALLASFDRDTCSWRTLQQSFLTDSEPFSQTWPRWGMTAGGFAYEHPMSGRRITETGGSCWPTPTVTTGVQVAWDKTPGQTGWTSLAGAVKYWRTPSATITEPKSTVVKLTGRKPTDPQVGLADQVGGQLSPDWVSWLMGFPIGFAQTGGKSSQKSGELPKESTTESASLKAMGMPKYHSKQQQHGDCLEANK